MKFYSFIIRKGEPFSEEELEMWRVLTKEEGPEDGEGQDLFKCDDCEAFFSTLQGVKAHHRQIHQLGIVGAKKARVEETPLVNRRREPEAVNLLFSSDWGQKCPICGASMDCMESHMKMFEPSPGALMECVDCGRRFKDDRALRQHALVHQNH